MLLWFLLQGALVEGMCYRNDPPATTFGNPGLKLYILNRVNSLPFCFLPLPPNLTLYILNSSSRVTGVTVLPLGSVQCGSMSIHSQKTSINPFSCFNTIDSNSLFAVRVATGHECGAGKNVVSFLQMQASAQEAPGSQDELRSN